MDASPVQIGYPADIMDAHRARAAAVTTTTRSPRVDYGSVPSYGGDVQDHLRARRPAPASARVDSTTSATAGGATARSSAGAFSDAKRKNHTKSIGHYILGKTIGEGTFGKVKLGTHILTGEKVAVKVLEKERIIDVADVERVAREVYILKLIRHQNVVQLYEIIETSRQLYLIMEYASGGELFDYIVASGRVQEQEACRFFRQILLGMEEIHKRNVVHRDLKPENLLLDEHHDIKIVDFGLSNTYRDGQLLKTACGSPCYAAPEMIAGKEYVPSLCDIWSCGVILFAMLCGYLPFEDQNTAALYRKILAAEYTLPDFLSPAARSMVSGMLTTDPTKRLTAVQIRQQPWFNINQEQDVSSRSQGQQVQYFEEDILEELEKFGFPPDYTQRCLRMNKHNHVTTTYHLLERKKQRMMDHVMLDQPPQDAAFDGGLLDQAGHARSPGSTLRQNEETMQQPHSARGYHDGSSSARGSTSQPRSATATGTSASRPGNSPPRTPTTAGAPGVPATAWSQVRDPRMPSSVYPAGGETSGGPPSPRTSARGPSTGPANIGSQPAQPRWAQPRSTPPAQPGAVSPSTGHAQYRSESPAGAAAAAAAAASRRPQSGTPRGVRGPSADRLPNRTGVEAYISTRLGGNERDRGDRSARGEGALDDRGPGTPGTNVAFNPQAGSPADWARSTRGSFGVPASGLTASGVAPSTSTGSRAAPGGISSPGGVGPGQNGSGRLPSPPRYNKNPAVPGQNPSARPLTSPTQSTTAPNSARGSIPPSSSRGASVSAGGSHSLSTRAALSMSPRPQTPQTSSQPDASSRTQTPSRSAASGKAPPPPKPSHSHTPPEPHQQSPTQSQHMQQPRSPLFPHQQAAQSASGGIERPLTPNLTPGAPSQHATPPVQAPGFTGQPQLHQPVPGTPPRTPPQMHQHPMSGTQPSSALSPGTQPGSTAAALAALRARRPYGVADTGTPRSEANTPRGHTSSGMGASSGSHSARGHPGDIQRGQTPPLGQPGSGSPAAHAPPRWPGAGSSEPGRIPRQGEQPASASDRSQADRMSQDRPLSSRVAPASDLDGSIPASYAPLSARDAAAAPLSSREAREDRRAALDTLRTSSRPPRLIMQELQRVLNAQRVTCKQSSPLTLRCHWLTLKFDVEVAPLDRLGSIHAVRARRTAGEPWQYKDVCNRLLAELRIA